MEYQEEMLVRWSRNLPKHTTLTSVTAPQNENQLGDPAKSGLAISIPSNPPPRSIEAEIQEMISSGRFSLGEECAPYKITRYVYENGQLTPYTFVQARKVPLKQIRERLLNKHLQYMRLTPSTQQVSRCLCMWHDHARRWGLSWSQSM